MASPKFSVIIPAYNQAQFLPDAIQSVLDQTESNFELIIVNDSSPDNTSEVIAQYTDPRIKILTHEVNQGLPASRNTGMLAASGEFIALLDSDDYFHKEKLVGHSSFFSKNPDVDVAYNNRFELHHSSKEIRAIYQPPATVDISDLALGFPFSPSDMVFRRSCTDDVGWFDDRYKCGGEDLDFPCRLALAQKSFQRINKALNYRRFHSGRKKKNLTCRLDDYTKALDKTFSDSRFHSNQENIIQASLVNRYLEVACWALAQEDYKFGNDLLKEIQTLDQTVFSGQPTRLTKELLKHSIRDINQDHEQILRKIFGNLDHHFQKLAPQLHWAIPRGYLLKGFQELVFDRIGAGFSYLEAAKQHKASIDYPLLDKIVAQLVLIHDEIGEDAVRNAFSNLSKPIRSFGGKSSIDYLNGTYGLSRAFSFYQSEQYNAVLNEIFWILKRTPSKLINRGAIAITLKSTVNLIKQQINS